MSKSNGKAAKATIEQMSQAPSEAMKHGFERAMSFAGEMSELSRANVAAFAESAQATRKGVEAINARYMGYFKDAMDRQAEATKTMSSAKTFQEAVELQSAFAKSAFETYVAEMNAMAGLMSSTMRDAVEPLNAQAGVVVEKLQAAR